MCRDLGGLLRSAARMGTSSIWTAKKPLPISGISCSADSAPPETASTLSAL